MPLLPNVNLPWPMTLHAFGLTFYGLYQTFRLPSSPKTTSSRVSTPPTNPMLGIATFGLGLAYFTTSYMPLEQNQFFYATVPVRIILACMATARLVLDGKVGSLSKEDRINLLMVVGYDGLSAVVLGWWLGSFGGRVPRL
ncbi:hypothetical protein ONS95_004166 [Cadophora gregata]|uniref:uncharacterized protein n=1 Tax=Cadophora gregata TaxID=51156 RepID=UPI0026DCA8A7|nr:uncharacterized protein ONS95_004166 [Cadophora gregata]KAK0105469.1 hypothetical protein ONS96_004855 [Cadophora gregata f. sp. sojae]KAK0105636.1 hypothetical protein ONS95_004166 [Cadophora gregata]